jgi:catechol-2,3-dioxygenase
MFALPTVILGAALPLSAADADASARPKILGVAHMAIYVKDLDKTEVFYEGFLGYREAFSCRRKGGGAVRIAFVKVNDNQYLENSMKRTEARASSTTSLSIPTTPTACMRI